MIRRRGICCAWKAFRRTFPEYLRKVYCYALRRIPPRAVCAPDSRPKFVRTKENCFARFRIFAKCLARAGSRTLLRQQKELDTRSSSFCWCGRRELNPYGKTTRPSNVRVCQFRHSRSGLLYYTQVVCVCQAFFIK